MAEPAVCLEYARYHDGRRFRLTIVREDLSGLNRMTRREHWGVYARTEEEAHKTVDWHFGRSALWYSLMPPLEENSGSTTTENATSVPVSAGAVEAS